MVQIFHNPRCSKSREGLALLQDSGAEFEIVKYLETIPTKAELQQLVARLGIKPIDLVRTGEAVWKERFAKETLTDDAVLEILAANPILIERPIVINGSKAVIGRPPSRILDIL